MSRIKILFSIILLIFSINSIAQVRRHGLTGYVGVRPIATTDTTLTLVIDYDSNISTIGVLGSSMWAGYGLTGGQTLQAQFSRELTLRRLSPTVNNLAIFGYVTGNILPSGQGGVSTNDVDAIIAAKPDVVIMGLTDNNFAGISSTSNGNTVLTALYKDYDTIRNYLYRNGIPLVVWGGQCARSAFGTFEGVATDSANRANQVKYSRFYSNIYPFTVQPGTLSTMVTGYDQGDGVHYDSLGTAPIAKVWAGRVAQILRGPRSIARYYVDTSSTGTSNWGIYDSSNSVLTHKTYNRISKTQTYYYRARYKSYAGTITTSLNYVGVNLPYQGGVTPISQFNFSSGSQPVTGWTNVAGDPATGIRSATDVSTGWTVSSTASSNWNGTFVGSQNAFDGFGQTIDDGGGFAFPAAVALNYWYNYTDTFSTSSPKYQVKVTGLNATKKYKIVILSSRSNSNGATAPRISAYHILGNISYGPDSVVAFQNTSKVTTKFKQMVPASDGSLSISVNPYPTSGGLFAYLNGMTVQLDTTTSSAPSLSSSTTNLSGFTVTQNNGPSATIQTANLTGNNLTASVKDTVTSAYLISFDQIHWGTTATSVPVSGSLVPITTSASGGNVLYIKLDSSFSTGVKFATVTISSTGVSPIVINLSGTVNSPNTPTLIVTPTTLTGFNGNSPVGQSFTISAHFLVSNATLTPSTLYNIKNGSGGTYANTALTLTQSGDSILGQPITIFAIPNSSASGNANPLGTVTGTATGATNAIVTLNTASSNDTTNIKFADSTNSTGFDGKMSLSTWNDYSVIAPFTGTTAFSMYMKYTTGTLGPIRIRFTDMANAFFVDNGHPTYNSSTTSNFPVAAYQLSLAYPISSDTLIISGCPSRTNGYDIWFGASKVYTGTTRQMTLTDVSGGSLGQVSGPTTVVATPAVDGLFHLTGLTPVGGVIKLLITNNTTFWFGDFLQLIGRP